MPVAQNDVQCTHLHAFFGSFQFRLLCHLDSNSSNFFLTWFLVMTHDFSGDSTVSLGAGFIWPSLAHLGTIYMCKQDDTMVSLVVLGVSFRLMIISDHNDGAFMVMSHAASRYFHFRRWCCCFLLAVVFALESRSTSCEQSLCFSHTARAKPDAQKSLATLLRYTSEYPILLQYTSLLIPERQ